MKINNHRFFVGFAAVAVAVFAAGVWLRGWDEAVSGDGVGAIGGAGSGGGGARSPVPDKISVVPLPSGDTMVANASAGYFFSMPANWYLENRAGAGIAVYPDYDPKSGASPECKLEISVFVSASSTAGGKSADVAHLGAWITDYLRTDPTADIREISRTPFLVDSNPAIEWRGILNNVTTTLIYSVMPVKGNNQILEVAPSTLSGAGDAGSDDCDFDLQALVANLKFGAYEP